MSESEDKENTKDSATATVGWMELSEKDLEVIYYKGKLYRCPMCEKAFRTRSQTTQHFNTEHRSFIHRCNCGKEYKSKGSLTTHQKKCAKKWFVSHTCVAIRTFYSAKETAYSRKYVTSIIPDIYSKRAKISRESCFLRFKSFNDGRPVQ